MAKGSYNGSSYKFIKVSIQWFGDGEPHFNFYYPEEKRSEIHSRVAGRVNGIKEIEITFKNWTSTKGIRLDLVDDNEGEMYWIEILKWYLFRSIMNCLLGAKRLEYLKLIAWNYNDRKGVSVKEYFNAEDYDNKDKLEKVSWKIDNEEIMSMVEKKEFDGKTQNDYGKVHKMFFDAIDKIQERIEHNKSWDFDLDEVSTESTFGEAIENEAKEINKTRSDATRKHEQMEKDFHVETIGDKLKNKEDKNSDDDLPF